jgi:hypothetical protein
MDFSLGEYMKKSKIKSVIIADKIFWWCDRCGTSGESEPVKEREEYTSVVLRALEDHNKKVKHCRPPTICFSAVVR